MSERGKASYLIVATGSNTSVKSTPGTLYRVLTSNPSNSTVRVQHGDMGTTPDFNTPDANTIVSFKAPDSSATQEINFWPGLGFDALTIAATSNARLSVFFE